ncbi:MAG: ABC transporter permease [Chitinophagaceae bacterium]
MIKSYFKIAWRNLIKQKFYSLIKIGGFAIGIAACLLIALFIQNELSYDKSYKNADRIFRLVGVEKQGDYINKNVAFPAPFARAIKDELPEVEKAARINPSTLFTGGGNLVRIPDATENNYEEGFSFADPEIIDLFQIKMIYGNPAAALQQPGSVVISKKIADKYYHGQNPVGKTLIIGDKKDEPVMISGVMNNFPVNSHLHFDFLLSLKDRSFFKGEQSSWTTSNYHTYIRVKPGTDAKSLGNKMMTALFDKYLVPAFKADGLDEKSIGQIRNSIKLELQPVSDIYLATGIDDSFVHGDVRIVWLFGTIAVFILVLAMINFINLSTAKSANRAKEVGIRKAIGSLRKNLVNQFLSESVLFSIISFLTGVGLAALFLPEFNRLAGKTLSIPFANPWFIIIIIAMGLITGIIAGLYPALYLSSFKPVQVLKGNLAGGAKNGIVRSSLVVFQFTISIALIIGTIVVARQMNFILNTKVGFEKDQVLLLQGTGSLANQAASFKNRLKQIPEVKYVSMSDYLPVSGLGSKRNATEMWEKDKDKNALKTAIQIWQVDNEYIPAMGMKIKEGRNFSPDIQTDSSATVINETMADQLNFKNPVGKQITNGYLTLTVIGVVEDFNFESLKDNVGGVCLRLGNSPSMTAVKISGGSNIASTIKSVTSAWKEFTPSQPVRYSFLDEAFARMYNDVLRVKNIFMGFALFAILVSCLGLFALSAFIAEQRRKEIGIRKVLGASVGNVSMLLSKDFIKLVFIAMLIASPVAYYFMNNWLQDYQYRTNLSWWIFAAAGVGALVITLLTVSFQAIKAAVANPVKSLRTE